MARRKRPPLITALNVLAFALGLAFVAGISGPAAGWPGWLPYALVAIGMLLAPVAYGLAASAGKR